MAFWAGLAGHPRVLSKQDTDEEVPEEETSGIGLLLRRLANRRAHDKCVVSASKIEIGDVAAAVAKGRKDLNAKRSTALDPVEDDAFVRV
eukprot:2740087-Pleurochrysis_carterae.AAC.1